MDNRQDPFSWMVNANVNVNLYGIVDLPFSAMFTSQNRTFNQPSFNQYGVSPKYKWITLHAGYRSMNLSNYTLGGITYLGGGIELSPENLPIKFKAMYGRLAKGLSFRDTINNIYQVNSFDRWGYGGMLTLGNQTNNIDLILFKASDRKPEAQLLPDSNVVRPSENLVMSIRTAHQLFEIVSVKAEYALSAFTPDTRIDELYMEKYSYLNNLGDLFTPRANSRVNNMFAVSADVSAEYFGLGISYRRVAPDYTTMGCSYLENDVEDIAVNASTSLLKNKLSLSGSLGKQHNNLDGQRSSKSQRTISSLNAAYSPWEWGNFNLNYSNFTTSTEPTYVYFIDSVKYMQICSVYGVVSNFTFGEEAFKHNISLTNNYQSANTLNNAASEVEQSGTKMYNNQLSYRLNYMPWSGSVMISGTYNVFTADTMVNVTTGPVIGLNRNFKRLKMNSSLTWSILSNNVAGNGSTVQLLRFNLSYKAGKSHSIRLSASVQSRKGNKSERNAETGEQIMVMKTSYEEKVSLTYNYSF